MRPRAAVAALVVTATVIVPLVVHLLRSGELPAHHAVRPHPLVLDVRAGSFQRVRIGQPRARAARLAGPTPVQPGDGAAGPLDSDFSRDGTASNWRPPENGPQSPALRYRGHSTLISRRDARRVYGFILTDTRAQTTAGVGIGDTLAYARTVYPRLRCDIVNDNTEYVEFPACRAKVAPHRYLGFGRDPIRSITLMTVPFDGAT